ncbi:dnaJ homolog subfamily C member 17 isoform X2 [Erpetoichthys calabaricus]|uniref:dnaJ homolog subfamily C member 17 isoform X2 n=1 Tax=Erpetoichthys calabaricus TaxID=27687 RepID=UPI0010A041F5|nr:dnaJ homolog subfamily C member 17 isoform X2 [Erpetoichthys calabaricus]
MSKAAQLQQTDLYGLIGVDIGASDKEIKRAYRLKALTCHPDKNPDNPKAAELFHQLSQALEILTDAAARAAYDKLRRAQKQAEERTQKLDDKRKKIKLDLEAREREAQTLNVEEDEFSITQKLEEEIARLQEEGSRQLEEQQRLIREQIQREQEARLGSHGKMGTDSSVTPKLKLKWKSTKHDKTNGGYSHSLLVGLLHKYGDVLNVLISNKKNGSAIVEFATLKAATLAFKNERGLVDNPLKISWLEGQVTSEEATSTKSGQFIHGTNQMAYQTLSCENGNNLKTL